MKMSSLLKRVSLLGLFMGASLSLSGQYEEGRMQLNGGLGLVSTYGSSSYLPLSLSGEYGIGNNISVGPYLGFGFSSRNNLFFNTVNYSYYMVGGRGIYYLDLLDEFETYGGVMLGIWASTVSYTGSFSSVSPPSGNIGISTGLFAGARYHFSEQWAGFGELGYGTSILTLGLSYRL